jgi:hypothetical protein
MRLEHWLNDSEWGKPRYVNNHLSPCHSFRTKPTLTGLGSNPRLHDTRMATGAICYNSNACKQTDSQSGRRPYAKPRAVCIYNNPSLRGETPASAIF